MRLLRFNSIIGHYPNSGGCRPPPGGKPFYFLVARDISGGMILCEKRSAFRDRAQIDLARRRT